MKKSVKRGLMIAVIWFSAGFLAVILWLVSMSIDVIFPRQYITTDLNDYGKYVGNHDNKSVREFITSFFPDKIREDFKDVKYSYRAQKGDTYAFEAYLEFCIEDNTAFKSYIAENTGDGASVFQYDSDFKEYIVSDYYLVSSAGEEILIKNAGIGKILYSEKDQRIIYVALGVYDGGTTPADFLCVYFERFDIDPVDYQRGTWGRIACPPKKVSPVLL